MSRRKNQKPHLLNEATVKKFMKLADLGDLSGDFRRTMGYEGTSQEDKWEQPGLSQYRSALLREQDEEELMEPEGDMDMDAAPEEAPMDEPAAEAGGMEDKVEDIVAAIADAIEEVVPEVSVDVAGADAAAEAPMEEPAAEEPPMEEEPPMAELSLRETVRRAIREAMLQKEELATGSAPNPSKEEYGAKDPALDGKMPEQLSEQEEEVEEDDDLEVLDVINLEEEE